MHVLGFFFFPMPETQQRIIFYDAYSCIGMTSNTTNTNVNKSLNIICWNAEEFKCDEIDSLIDMFNVICVISYAFIFFSGQSFMI